MVWSSPVSGGQLRKFAPTSGLIIYGNFVRQFKGTSIRGQGKRVTDAGQGCFLNQVLCTCCRACVAQLRPRVAEVGFSIMPVTLYTLGIWLHGKGDHARYCAWCNIVHHNMI